MTGQNNNTSSSLLIKMYGWIHSCIRSYALLKYNVLKCLSDEVELNAARLVLCEITSSFISWQLSHPYKFPSHCLEWQRRVEE